MIILDLHTTKAVVKFHPEKNSDLKGIRTYDLYTVAVLSIPTELWRYFTFTTAYVGHMTAMSSPPFKYMIFHIFTCKQDRCRHFEDDLQLHCYCHDSSANQIVTFALRYTSVSFVSASSFNTKHANLTFYFLEIYSSDKGRI